MTTEELRNELKEIYMFSGYLLFGSLFIGSTICIIGISKQSSVVVCFGSALIIYSAIVTHAIILSFHNLLQHNSIHTTGGN
jgi:hypothetical protein